MNRRTYESHMDWEYQDHHGPMDPSSPFTSVSKAQQSNSAFGQSIFNRTQSSPSKSQPPTNSQPSSIFSPQSHLPRTTTAPPFRNAAFTTPRKPFDTDALSEVSAAESSPAATDASDYAETPEMDRMRNLTTTPSRNKQLTTHVSGKGEIPRTLFSTRDKIRKRKRYYSDKDVRSFRLPYKQQDEWDESDEQDSDDSTFAKSRRHQPEQGDLARNRRGWFGNFLSAIQKHPYAPSILGYWLQLGFHVVCTSLAVWVIWSVVAGFRDDFQGAKEELRAEALAEMQRCAQEYTENRCSKDQRVRALETLCQEWEACMNQDPDRLRRVQLGAKNIVEILNEIFETMHWKTLLIFVFIILMLFWSAASILKSSQAPIQAIAPPPQQSQSANQQWLGYNQIPTTPHHSLKYLRNEETPDTDASPSDYRILPPPSMTPGRRSPSKDERGRSRGRSPTKSRSPVKRH